MPTNHTRQILEKKNPIHINKHTDNQERNEESDGYACQNDEKEDSNRGKFIDHAMFSVRTLGCWPVRFSYPKFPAFLSKS